ncbi:MAG TPA: hypothetical protein VF783_18150 [Terriglobales bacterium]
MAKQREPLSEQAAAYPHLSTSSNHFRIGLAQFVAAEEHPPKVGEASFVVVAFPDMEKSRERRLGFHLVEDCVHDQRHVVQTNLEREISALSQISHV